MNDGRHFRLDELTIRPGTYFNPQTEVLLVVDDSPEVDHEIFDVDELDEGEWVLISDDTPLDEPRRDDLIEQFQVSYQPSGHLVGEDDPQDDEEDEDELDVDELGADEMEADELEAELD
jgi:hypothetical protein